MFRDITYKACRAFHVAGIPVLDGVKKLAPRLASKAKVKEADILLLSITPVCERKGLTL
ncbi:hypothetical protein PZ895_14075 [Mesorhizobium sp. YIM 152430]|uniref:hypothetical protein n=1 Tax=Mesorhizobium sp. YIM 152430 TaxID=3031761 RepID=UPI0023DC8FA5|nr:hypothetical protein [Mesorhizobium sp. YIM 152430]MDF1600890.1 hypothetical protein [Mesorhizobium sp. YIM 152430]